MESSAVAEHFCGSFFLISKGEMTMRLDKFFKGFQTDQKDVPLRMKPVMPERVLINGRTAKKHLRQSKARRCDRDPVWEQKAVKVEVLDVQETVKKDNAAELYKYL